ncbi:natural cytotoxicity triggering receptor 3-like [Acipenser ruthenus]|uniref:natural cytotoxicity triggering receptor 3-like n=1 Tax=Acipenser ruthenus TaxID=7906 RepID=UPI002741FC51|nr:natural cytotoxicity triggering receptor 3-like [Acipenser ruthenus]
METFDLILLLLTGVACQNIIVFQPPTVEVTEGEKAHLKCTFNSTAEDSVTGSAIWKKGCETAKSLLEHDDQMKGRLEMANARDFKTKHDASIYIHNVTERDSGIYYCELDLVSVGKLIGSGTYLNVKRLPCNSQVALCEDLWILSIVRISLTSLLTIAMIVFICISCRLSVKDQ